MRRFESFEYKNFMKEYNNKHKLCPKCKDNICISTLAAYIYNPESEDSYKDLNKCTCCKCGDVHTRHERVSE